MTRNVKIFLMKTLLGSIVELVHHTDGCEEMTENEISLWINRDTEHDLNGQDIISIATEKQEEEHKDSKDDDPNSTQEKCITPDEVFKALEVSYVSLY